MKSRRQLRDELRKNLRRHRILTAVLVIAVGAMAVEILYQRRAIRILTAAVYYLVTQSEPQPADTMQPADIGRSPDDRTY